MHPVKALGRMLFSALPEHNEYLYRFCRKYVDRANGDNDFVPETNGEYAVLQRVLPRIGNGVFFDIGANVGDWSAWVLGARPGVTIHAFEPSASTFGRLLERPWPANVHLNNFGMGNAEGTVALNVFGDGSGLNSIYARRGVAAAASSHLETIRLSTVDLYCERANVRGIDVAKLDVEGHELAVLQGMQRMLAEDRVGLIQFEYGGCNLDSRVLLGDIWAYLETYGFRFYKLFPGGPRLVSGYSQELETFRYSNWIVARRQDLLT